MWKGAICFGAVRVPVKFYAAVADRSVHFRLLHEKDRVPVKQAMVNPETDDVVAYADAERAYVTEDHEWVVLDEEDLNSIEPEASREIEILHFLPPRVIDHRWYLRPHYLGPDGDDEKYAALVRALENTTRKAWRAGSCARRNISARCVYTKATRCWCPCATRARSSRSTNSKRPRAVSSTRKSWTWRAN